MLVIITKLIKNLKIFKLYILLILTSFFVGCSSSKESTTTAKQSKKTIKKKDGLAGLTEKEQIQFNNWRNFLNENVSALDTDADVYRAAGITSGAMEDSYFTVARINDNEVDVTREEVQFTIVKPGETILPDHEPETLVEAR